jgi:hypothetical protein
MKATHAGEIAKVHESNSQLDGCVKALTKDCKAMRDRVKEATEHANALQLVGNDQSPSHEPSANNNSSNTLLTFYVRE